MITRRSFLKLLGMLPVAAYIPPLLAPAAIAETLPEVDPPLAVGLHRFCLEVDGILIHFSQLSVDSSVETIDVTQEGWAARRYELGMRRNTMRVATNDSACLKLRDTFHEMREAKIRFRLTGLEQEYLANGVISGMDVTAPNCGLIEYTFSVELFDLAVA